MMHRQRNVSSANPALQRSKMVPSVLSFASKITNYIMDELKEEGGEDARNRIYGSVLASLGQNGSSLRYAEVRRIVAEERQRCKGSSSHVVKEIHGSEHKKTKELSSPEVPLLPVNHLKSSHPENVGAWLVETMLPSRPPRPPQSANPRCGDRVIRYLQTQSDPWAMHVAEETEKHRADETRRRQERALRAQKFRHELDEQIRLRQTLDVEDLKKETAFAEKQSHYRRLNNERIQCAMRAKECGQEALRAERHQRYQEVTFKRQINLAEKKLSGLLNQNKQELVEFEKELQTKKEQSRREVLLVNSCNDRIRESKKEQEIRDREREKALLEEIKVIVAEQDVKRSTRQQQIKSKQQMSLDRVVNQNGMEETQRRKEVIAQRIDAEESALAIKAEQEWWRKKEQHSKLGAEFKMGLARQVQDHRIASQQEREERAVERADMDHRIRRGQKMMRGHMLAAQEMQQRHNAELWQQLQESHDRSIMGVEPIPSIIRNYPVSPWKTQ